MIKLLTLILALTAVFAYEKEGEVLVLADADFPQVLQDYPYLLIEFYAPWCGHCKHLAPIYTEAAAALAKENSPIHLAKVDATKHGENAGKYGVRGYPTLFFFKNGEPIEFKGGRSKEGIINWCTKRIQPATSELTDASQLDTLSSKDHVSIVLFSDDEETIKAFAALADKDDNNRYYIAKGEALAARAAGTVEVFRNWDAPKSTSALDKLESWIGRNAVPPVGDLNDHAIEAIFRDGKLGLVLLNPTESEIEASRTLLNFAKQFEEDISIVFVELRKGHEHFDRLPQFLKLKNDYSRIFIIDASNQKKHLFSGSVDNLTSESLSEFILNVHNNRQSTGIELQEEEPNTQESHDGHDHEGHDHEGHDHEGHSHEHQEEQEL